ncbi:leukotoxin LktA family filamentous adhesin [uncultured Bosea sp.]|uniref:leukotoxin LktA family filamentous adhesin n=1 Tax=uncultured Bosea sp. TaxID=211457 RepID=UPI0025CEB1C6|nr:leukotoxin LktA family filamentous adhesin [uncultured Bosea sp.]
MSKRRSPRPAQASAPYRAGIRRNDAFATRPRSILASWRQRCLVGQAMALALWNAPAFAQNLITPDGRTQTSVSVNGTTTTITTQTVSGGAGYNSFSRFEQAAGTTVNMHLPQNTGALVNIVRDGPVVINGILNSYRNGQIGGHIYFSDSAGFTVGPNGVINTGQLTVNTPTREFLDQVIGPNGVVNEALAARLRANDVPISADGTITVDGRINARRGVSLNGHSVSVAGQIAANASTVDIGERRRQHGAAFAQSVNTNGMRQGATMVARRGGGIEIVAADTASISGSLNAAATGRRSAGSIAIRSGKGTTIAATARITATGAQPKASSSTASGRPSVNTGEGGTVSIVSDGGIAIARGALIDVSAAQGVAAKGGSARVFAGTNLDVESGAVFRGTAGSIGDGGFLELSARGTVTLGAVDVDLSARNGKAGLLYIDPTDIVIGTGGSANMITNGTNVSLEASNSITIASDGIIDTRNFNRSANNGELSVANPSLGNSGSITLAAPSITVSGKLLAGVSSGSSYAAGDVTLDATTAETLIAGRASASSTIDIYGTITGRDVLLKADATAVASYVNFSPGSLVALAAQTAAGIAYGLNGGYVGSDITSRVQVATGATIEATRDVSITAQGRQEASLPAITITGSNVFGGAVSIGEIAGTVTADIASGATINVGRNLAVRAENDVKLGVSAISVTVGTALAAATVAYGNVDVTTAAKVHSGATITTGGLSNVSVTALNTNSFSTSATSVAASGGVAGAAIAYSDYKAQADALLGASLGTSTNKVKSITVSAVSDTTKNATSASTTVGDNLIFNAGPSGTTVSTLLSQIFGKLSSGSSSVPVKAGSAIAIADSSLGASAAIAADSGAVAPTLNSDGNVVVTSRQSDFGVRLIADSSINSNSKDPTSAQPEAQVSLSFGIGVGNYAHESTAFIGSGVTINAYRIGVGATNEMPISNTWTNWAGPLEVVSHLNGNLGTVNNIMTSYANASSQSQQLGLAGAVDYFRVTNDTSAYVASGATLNTTALASPWTTTLADGYVQDWNKAVNVIAGTTVHSIDGGGNFGLTGGLNGGAGSAAGGSLLSIGRTSRTVAAIADGATITATGLDVKATTSDVMYVVVTSSGRAQGTVLSGMAGLASLNNQTLASISNRAVIVADVVAVAAEQAVSVLSVSGGIVVAGTGGSSAGVSVGRIDATTITRGYIGDNSGDLSDDRLRGTGTTPGRIETDSLSVQATTSGWLSAASVAAAVVDGTMDFVTDDPFFAVVSAASASQGGGKPSFALAGSAAVASTQLGTSAWIDGARVEAKTNAVSTAVTALNSTILELGSGSAAINLTGAREASSASLAGAIAFAKLDNSTDARISQSSLTDVGDTSVRALAGGRATVVGLGLAGSGGGNAAAAMSVALGLVTNRVSASIVDSTLIAPANASVSNLVTVDAYQTTDIGIGGGAAYAGAKNGVGIALTYVDIGDPDGEDAVSAKVTRSTLTSLDRLQVRAANASRIVSSAITAGLGGNALGGAFVINRITPTTNAAISGVSGALATVSVAGDVVVLADGSRIGVYDDLIRGRQSVSAGASQVDFSGAVANGGTANSDGAAVLAITGTVQAGTNNVGVSLLSNTIAQSHLASIDFATVTAGGNVSVVAQDGATLTGVAIGFGAATGQFAGTASVVLQSIENVVRARIDGVGTSVTAGGIAVSSNVASSIRGSAGSLGIGIGAAALGLSVVESNVANMVSSEVADARLRATGDVVLLSGSTARIDTVAVGVAISRNVGLAGSVANNSVATDVAATITGADIIADNNLGVFAANSDQIGAVAGALGVTVASPSIAGGLSIVNNSIEGATTASISDSTVDARAGGSGALSYNAGQLVSAFDLSTANNPSSTQPSLAMSARSIHGLGVVATSQQSVLANSVTGAVSIFPISGAIAVVPIRNVLAGSTSAVVDDSAANTRLTGTDSTAVAIEAASHSYAATFITVGSAGGAAAAGADANTIMGRTTHAGLTNSTLGTTTPGFAGAGVTALDIAANASQSAASNVLGFAIGIGGAAASGVVNSFAATTTATLDQGLVTAGRVGINAESRNGFYAQAATGAAGGVGMGSSFVVGTSRNTTLATIGGGSGQTALNLNGALAVAARSVNDFTTLSAGGAAGGFAGVAGMVSFVDVENETRAGLYGVTATLRPASLAGISVTANETTSIDATTAAGANGAFGAGAAANIASLDSRVLADITGSILSAPGAVSASATSDRTVDANTMTYGVGGSVGIGAAVAVISVGTGTPSGAGAELNAGGNGTLARVDQLTAGNAALVLSASGLTAYRTYRGAAGAAMSDAALRDAAQTDYNQLLANGSVANGALTLTNSGVTALRSAAATALGIASPTDQQVRDWAAQRYTALSGGAVSYLMSDAGVSAYRSTVTATTPDASADQIRSAANDAYARLLTNGTVSNGVLTLSSAGLAAYRADASASLGHAASDAEVRAYAGQQYSFFNANRSRIVAPAAQSASALLDSDGSRTAATVTGGSITSGSVAVSSLSRTTTSNIASGVGAGGAAGGGAATAYTNIGDNVVASLAPTTANTGTISVTATSADGTGSAARVEATAGAGALAAAAGAAVAKGTLSNQVSATLGGALTTIGATTVTALNSQTGRSDAFGATVAGGLALGVSLAKSAAESTVAANYLAGSSFTGTGLSINATSRGAAHAAAVAGVGGLLAAGAGADADADDTTNVSATIGAGARANVGTGTITVAATASPDAKAFAKGAAVAGGLAVGVAVANASAAPTVRAAIEDNASLPASQFTAGTLSVLATGSVFGTSAGDASELPDATGDFSRGGTSAAASAIAGSGAYYVAATGTDAQAHNTASVTASIGNYVRLPTGTVTVTASNTTIQTATATGITAAGTAAIGSVNAKADSGATTLASLGDGASMAAGGAGSFSLSATGSDTQIVHAKAGSGGLYAGSGAVGKTGNTATVTTSVGENAVINTGRVTIAASHDDSYAALIDSLQASAVGASAALGRHDATVHVLTTLGAGSRITATGPNTAGCYLSSCQQAVSITSRNAFTQLDLGDTVQAAAGGGINGAGATSITDITGTSKVILGDNVGIASGMSPTAAPGPMLLQAWTELTADDTASLTTGGLLQGAGVTAHYGAHVDNEVTLGSNDALSSFGAINIGTYTTATVRANAYVNTYGLASVGLADADVTVITNNDVKVGANSSLIGLADVNVVAGRDGSGLRLNSLTGVATALGYVRGIIAVPDADASTDLQNHAKVQVDYGATISSAQNIGLGAYDGLLNAQADGTGHGYQLYFIPVTSGTSSPGFSSSSTLVMNGTATAGIYNTQRIEIGCGPTASVQCGPNDTPTIRFISGAPVTAGYNPAFDAVAYVNANYDPTVSGTLISGVSSSPVKAVRLSQLYAAGGNVRVNGSRVEGSGTLTANGGPSITVINRSNAYLLLDGGAYIPETTGGQIIGSSGSLTRHTNPDATPVITIDNSYTGALDASGKGPGLLISGDITNLAGVVSLNNTQGSFGFSGQRIDALQFNTTVPNGAVVVSSNGPNGMYNAGAAPQAEYAGAIYYPGGGPGDALNVNEAVFAVANALAYGQGATNLNYFLYGKQDEGTRRNFSMQFYGNCIGYIGDAGYACTGGYDMGNDIRFMVIPDRQVYRESNPTAAGGGTKIYGSQVAIKATTININASIEAGRITDWQGTIGGNVGDILRSNRQDWLRDGTTTVSFSSIFGGGWSAPNAVPISYDVVNDRLVMADVNASSGGGSVLLDGQIISTNTLGNIKVNGGFGNVSVNNQSGLDLVTNRINTGTAAGVNASTSKITIIDRLITSGLNTKIYAYTPGVGIAIYKTMNGAQPTSGPVEFIAGATASYDPVAGTRYEWTQQALLQKEGLTPQTTQVRDLVSYWRYDSGTSGNPWVYVDAQSPSTNPGADWMYWWSRNAQAPSGGVSGRITNKPGLTSVGLTQEITGGQLDFINNEAHYSGCNLQAINHCDRDFVAQPGAGQAIWNYQMVTRAFVQVTASVKADNRVGISFAGNAAGTVNINSNSSVLLQGNIVNPSGSTTITASAGSITQAPNVSLLSNNLTLNARDSIGTASQAITTTLTSGAQLSATTGSGGINLDITGSARIAALRADGTPGTYGDIRVHATGSLDSVVTASANVIGRNITLSSDTGSIGSIANPIKMRAVATLLPNGSYVDGVVNVSALGDIGIAQVSGDLRVGEIASETGNVRIDVAAGRLVSATGQTAAQALSADQLSQVSRSLKLTSADGADAAALASVASFEKQVTQSYGLYIALVRNGSVSTQTVGGVSQKVFTLSDNAIPLYQAFADAALGHAASAQEVKDYAASRYAAYSGVFEMAYGSGWASQTRFNPATADNSFSFSAAASDAAPGLATRIAGDAVWTDRQLISAINKSALQPASGVVGNGTALVVGHDVTLNIAGSIGSLAPDMQVALDAIRNGSITDAQLAALSVATTAGSVKIMGQRQDGSLVEVTDLGNLPAGVTLTRVDVKQTAPLFINATGTFSASAQGDAYVQATTNVRSSGTPRAAGGTLTIGQISATGTINLQAPQGIVVGTQADGTTPRNPVQIQTGGDLVLAAGGGGIGSAATPLTYQIGGKLVSASAAAGDAYLVANAGTAEIGRIFASGTASLTARSGGIQGYLPGIAISASSVQLNATGNVGSASAALGLQTAATGSVTGQIGGQAWLAAPAVSGQSPSALRLGAIDAVNGLVATADGEIDVLGTLRSSAGAIALAGAKIVMSNGIDIQAAGRASLASGGDIKLGHVASALVAPAGTASIVITAAGSILANGDTGTLVDASGAGGVVSLQAGSGLGSATAAMTVAAPSLSARSLAGDIHIGVSGATHVTSLKADAGAASLFASGNLSVDTATTAGLADIATTAGTLGIASLTAGAGAALSASGAVTLGDASTTAGDLAVTSTSANLSLAALDIAGSLTLTAATSIEATGAIVAGGTAGMTAQNGTLTLASLRAGGATSLQATGLISLTSAKTITGAFSAVSSAAGITAGTIDVAGAATLTAAGPISVTTSLASGGAASVTTTAGALGVASLAAGTGATLSASGAVTLGDSSTTSGDLTVASTGANLSLAGLDIAGNLTLTAATSISATGAILAGGTADITAQNGRLTLASLLTGGATSLQATDLISLTSATTTAGAFSAVSGAAGITAGTINAAGAAMLTAAGPISVTTSLTAGDAASVTTTAGTLGIASLTAGAGATLSASGAVTLGDASTRAGDLAVTSTGANLSLAGLDIAGNLSLTAATSISVTGAILAGGTADVTAQNGTLILASLRAGGATSLQATGLISLTSATTTAGAFSAVSSAAGITAGTIDAAGAATLTAAGPVSVTTSLTAGGAAEIATTAGSLDIASLTAGGRLGLRAPGAVLVGTAHAGGDLFIRSAAGIISAAVLTSDGNADAEAAGDVTIGTLLAGRDIRLLSSQAGVVASTINSGGSAVIMAAGDIDGGTITARDTLAFLAGRSGQGSIRIQNGASRRLVAGAPDAVRLGRFSAGESIVITGTQIVADIVHLPGGDLPLALDITGFRERSADRVDLNVQASDILASRIAATDGTLTTTAGKVGIAEAFIPGAFAVKTPSMTVLTNNRSLAPDYAYDVQLYARGRPFYLDLDGSKLLTNAYIIRFDSDVVDIPPSAGGSLTRDLPRLGALLNDTAGEVAGSGFSFGAGGNWRSFWAGAGNWRGVPSGQPLEFVASAKPGQPPVNLDETEDRP